MSVRKEAERIFRFRVSESPFAQRVFLEGGTPEGVTHRDLQVATASYLAALLETVYFLADTIDSLKISESDGEA